jgi:hypothetical protein
MSGPLGDSLLNQVFHQRRRVEITPVELLGDPRAIERRAGHQGRGKFQAELDRFE